MDPKAPPLHREARSQRTRIAALIELLDDDSPVVWSEVRREFERVGKSGIAALLETARSGPPRLRPRARRMRLFLSRLALARRAARYASRARPEIERGFWLLSRFEEPDLDIRPYVLALDAMAAEILRRIDGKPATHERALILANYLGKELGYRGDDQDYHDPENVYLHRAIVRKRGLPLTLSAVYLLVARRAGLDAAVVPLPGHVMLRIHGGDKNVIVDPFHQGAVRSERELLQFLAQHGLTFQSNWFADADDRTLIARQSANLKNAFARRGMQREAHMLDLVLRALERNDGAKRPKD